MSPTASRRWTRSWTRSAASTGSSCCPPRARLPQPTLPVLRSPRRAAARRPRLGRGAGAAGGDAPLALASLSSTFMDQRALLQRIAEALGTLPVRGLLTTGPAVDPATVPAPGNVLVTAAAPHSAALSHAAVTVTHAGHGTVVKSLAAGVPLVCMPLGRDQGEVARRVDLAGAGITVGKGASPRTIARAVEKVLHDPSYRREARRLADEIAAETATDRAVAELEALAERAGRGDSVISKG
ncbi:glycosyltransferase [Actinomadura yumaensis]|uniref:glycosyltransferase n=1 Tax=Actinomadura yumaensis TaxID=111807 RepID=UPI0036182494